MTEAILNLETNTCRRFGYGLVYFLSFVGAVLAVGCTFGPAGTIAGRVSFLQPGWVVES